MLASWTKHDTATTGTGTITLGSAAAKHTTVGDHFADGELIWYSIEDGNNRENGIGLFTVSGTTLARSTVLETLVSGTYDRTSPTAINLSGSATVSISILPDTLGWPGLNPGADRHFIKPYGQDGTEGGTFAAVADTLYLVPLYVPVTGSYDAIRLDITVGAVGNYRVGIMSMGSDLQAPSLLATSASTSSNTTGKQSTSFSSAIFLNVGYYYMAFLCDATPTVRNFGRTQVGFATMVGVADDNFRARVGFTVSSVAGSPVLPASSGAVVDADPVPLLLLEAV